MIDGDVKVDRQLPLYPMQPVKRATDCGDHRMMSIETPTASATPVQARSAVSAGAPGAGREGEAVAISQAQPHRPCCGQQECRPDRQVVVDGHEREHQAGSQGAKVCPVGAQPDGSRDNLTEIGVSYGGAGHDGGDELLCPGSARR